MATDSETLEGTQDAKSGSSDDKAGQPSSKQEYITVEQYKELEKKLDTVLRTAQGDKDRAVKRVGERVDSIESSLKEVLQLAKKDGKTIDDVLAEAEQTEEREFRANVKSLAQVLNGQVPGVKPHGSGESTGVNVSEVLKNLELDLNDNRVKEFAGKQFKSDAEAYLEGAKLIKTISTRQPNEADLPGQDTERVRNAGKQEQLMAEYQAGSKNLRGPALINYKMQMRKKGLNIT